MSAVAELDLVEDDAEAGDEDAGAEQEVAEEVTPAPPPAPARKKPPRAVPVATPAPRPAGGGSSPLDRARRAEDEVVAQWLEEVGGAGEVHFIVSRLEPKTYQGIKTDGLLRTYQEPITVDQIAEDHGGGTFCIRIRKRNAVNKMVFSGSKNVQIAGVPRLESLRQRDEEEQRAAAVAAGQAAPPPATAGLADRAFEFATKMAESAQQAQRHQQQPAPAAPGIDSEMIASFTRPYEQAMARMEAQIERMNNRAEAPTHEDKVKDRVLDKLLDQDSARIEALRVGYETEIRTLKENYREDQKRDQAAWDRERERMVSDAKQAESRTAQHHDMVLLSVRTSLQGQIDFMSRELGRLEREAAEAKKEVEALRAKKDKTPFEIVKEVEAMRDLFGTGEEDKEKTSGIERVVTKAMESPIVQGLADRLMANIGPTSAEQEAAAQQTPPVGKPFRGQDGQVYVNNGQQIVLYRRKKKKEVVATGTDGAPPTPEEQEAAEAAANDVPNIDPETIKTVVGFMEGAFGRGTEPEVMAQSIKTQVPGDVLAYIGSHGVDAFLDQVASLPKTSPLAQQAGRNWVRKLAKALLNE